MEIFLIIMLMFVAFMAYGAYNVYQDGVNEQAQNHNKKLYSLRQTLEKLRKDDGFLKFPDKRYWIKLPYITENHTITVVKPDPFHPFVPEGGVLVFGSETRTIAILPTSFEDASADEITGLLNVTVGRSGHES